MSDNYDVIIVGTYEEARNLGARLEGSVLRLNGARVVSSCQNPSAIDGLRVGQILVSEFAGRGQNFWKIYEALQRARRKGLPS